MGFLHLTFPLDHAAFRRNRLNADDVIDSKSLERALREKPASTFSQRALAASQGRQEGRYRRRSREKKLISRLGTVAVPSRVD
ncbi:MAG: hypothetical protein FJX40_11050 [Alphaproteobacteria bacterium]|nr:hypothetical protein [Alphaproteobacteria bacterium]MBM3641538.1 hypothetical protein [Alphaproteobacteria bacterium]